MKRRDFLKQTTAAGVAALATRSAPAILGARDKSGGKNPIIGQGNYRYECIHNWGELPRHIRWETTHGVTLDEDGFIYIKHQGLGGAAMDTIVVFDPKGKYVRSFGKGYYPGGHGIDIRKEGGEQFLYLCDIFHRQVIKTNLKGEEVWKLCYPIEAGDKPGLMKTPHGIWLDDRPGREPSLVVADRANARLQYFTLDCRHIGFVNDLLFPAHFDIRGDVLLVPDLHARVSLFDRDNKPIVHLGDDPEWRRKVLDGFKVRARPEEWQAGKFVHPHDACFDRDGNFFVVEWVQTGRVTLLRRV